MQRSNPAAHALRAALFFSAIAAVFAFAAIAKAAEPPAKAPAEKSHPPAHATKSQSPADEMSEFDQTYAAQLRAQIRALREELQDTPEDEKAKRAFLEGQLKQEVDRLLEQQRIATAEQEKREAQMRAEAQKRLSELSDSEQVEANDLKVQLIQLGNKQRALRAEIVSICGLSPENVLPVLLEVEKQRFNLAIDEETKRAERDSLARGNGTANANNVVAADPVLQNLEKIVGFRKEAVQHDEALVATAAISPEEVKQAQAALAEAEIRAALRKEELTKAGGGASADDAKFAANLGFQLMEDMTRLAILDQKLDGLKRSRDALDEYNSVGDEIARLRERLGALESQIWQLGRSEREVPILNDIPYIDRIFRNPATGRTSE